MDALSALTRLKVLLVPRHPERFSAVADLLNKRGISWGRLSQSERLTGHERYLLIDQMGILNDCYQLADLAIVGGSFVPGIGGHNLLEPLWYGVPLLFGPYTEKQLPMQELILRYGAGAQVGLAELKETLSILLPGVGKKREEALLRGGELLLSIRGSLDRTWMGITPICTKVLEQKGEAC